MYALKTVKGSMSFTSADTAAQFLARMQPALGADVAIEAAEGFDVVGGWHGVAEPKGPWTVLGATRAVKSAMAKARRAAGVQADSPMLAQ